MPSKEQRAKNIRQMPGFLEPFLVSPLGWRTWTSRRLLWIMKVFLVTFVEKNAWRDSSCFLVAEKNGKVVETRIKKTEGVYMPLCQELPGQHAGAGISLRDRTRKNMFSIQDSFRDEEHMKF